MDEQPIRQNIASLLAVVVSRCLFVTKMATAANLRLCSLLAMTLLISELAPLLNLWIVKILTDGTILLLTSPLTSDTVRPVVLFTVLTAVVETCAAAARSLHEYTRAKLSNRLTLSMQTDLAHKFAEQDFGYFENSANQDLLSRTQSYGLGAVANVFRDIVQLIGAFLSITAAFAMLVCFYPLLGLLVLLCSIAGLVMFVSASNYEYRTVVERTARVRLSYYLWSLLTTRNAVRETMLLNLGGHFRSRWRSCMETTIKEDTQIAAKQSLAGLVGTVVSTLAYGAAYVFIALVSRANGGTFGTVTMNIGLFVRAQGQVQRLSQLLSSLYRNSVYVGDYTRVISHPVGIPQQLGRTLEEPIYSIEFRNVSFSYPGTQRLVLRGISFSIHRGERVLLRGRSGAGKTTILKLLLRLYEPTDGEILLNGRTASEYTAESIRDNCAAVMQEYICYPFSVHENVVLGNLKRQDPSQNVAEALLRASLEEAVGRLPQQAETVLGRVLGGEADLSGGEWQRLALARLFYRGASLIVLDEPTSSQDVETEASLLSAIECAVAHKIGVIVSHRASMAAWATRTLLVEDGYVSEVGGTHSSELLVPAASK